jgi:hypothetical protein
LITSATCPVIFGETGDATLLGINTQKDDQTTSYATIRTRDEGFGARRVSTTVGSSHRLSERSRIYSERAYSTYSGSLPLSLAPTFVGEEAAPGIWNSDIYGYEANFWDRWDFGLRFERRHLKADDFRSFSDLALDDLVRTNTFHTLSTTLGYTDTDHLKWDDSFEFRIDPDAPEVRQWLTQNSIEWRINQDLSFLGRLNFGTSRLVEPGDLAGRFLELNTGFAYRPVEWDRFNALARYTFLDELANDAQFVGSDSGTVPTDERAHIFAFEGAYELTKFLQTVEKVAYRTGSFETPYTERAFVNTFLWIHRFNYHVTRKWDVSAEYRMLFQRGAADTFRHGPLVEIDREFYDYVRLGIGYNFTEFDDDLRKVNDFRRMGPFVRLSGKI